MTNLPPCHCGAQAVQIIFTHGPHCGPCVEAFDAAFIARRKARQERDAQTKLKAKDDARQLQLDLAALRPSSIKTHLRSLTRREPAACGVYGDAYTWEPAEVTCRKCASPAKLRRPLPTDPTTRRRAIEALIGATA